MDFAPKNKPCTATEVCQGRAVFDHLNYMYLWAQLPILTLVFALIHLDKLPFALIKAARKTDNKKRSFDYSLMGMGNISITSIVTLSHP